MSLAADQPIDLFEGRFETLGIVEESRQEFADAGETPGWIRERRARTSAAYLRQTVTPGMMDIAQP